MKKKIVFLLILLLLTGCKAKYSLKINFGGGVTESGIIYLDKNLLGQLGNASNSEKFLENVANDYNFSNYKTKVKFNDDRYIGYKFYHQYHDISAISIQTPAIKTLFDGLLVNKNDHYVILKTKGSNKINDYINKIADAGVTVEEIEISISLPYRVFKSNATKIDTKTNTYTWRFNATSQNDINLEYRDNQYFTDDFLLLARYVSMYIYVLIFVMLLILLIFIYSKCKHKYKNRI